MVDPRVLDKLLPEDVYIRRRTGYMKLVYRLSEKFNKTPLAVVRRHMRDINTLFEDSADEMINIKLFYNNKALNDKDHFVEDFANEQKQDEEDVVFLMAKLYPVCVGHLKHIIINDPDIIKKLLNREDYIELMFPGMIEHYSKILKEKGSLD